MEIRDAEGRPVPDGTEGEVCARSAYNMIGYWRDPEATDASIDADRWLRTGDIGVLENGQLRLTTRRSDLIIRGGENVYPIEVENALAEHPGISECIVIGVPHPDLGHEVAAVVVFAGDPPTTEELTAFAKERLAYFKVPSRWHITTDPSPQRHRQGPPQADRDRNLLISRRGPYDRPP